MGNIFLTEMNISIDFSIEITIEVDVEVEVEVEVDCDAQYGIEEEVEIEVVEEEPEVEISYAIDTSGWQSWGQDVNVPARGWFDQGGTKYEMSIWDFRLSPSGEIRGAGSDAVGVFDVMGRMNGSFFRFDKVYRGAHTVVYRGTRNGSNLNGKWEIPGNCDGVFRIQTGWQKWQGGFFQGGFYSMDLDNMYVGESGVRGGGSDSVGSFDINGWRNGNTVCFAKQYHGAHTVYYQGDLNGRDLWGRWEIPGNCEGRFRLQCNRMVN